MASTQATIDLVVRGSNAVNKLVQDVNQLQSAVDRINSRTLDVGPANLQRRANSLAAVMEGSAARANDLGRDRNQILLQQRQAIERLTQAQLSQQRAIEKAASTEKELVRLGRRDELASRRVSELRDALRESAGQAEQFGDRMAEASASATTLQSRLNQIRQATRNAISAASGLIDVNQTLSAANAVNALAREYNKYGDSLRRSTRESGLTDRTLPRQIAVFGDLRNQIEQAETSLSGLRAQLRQLGSTEVAIDIPVRPVSQRELTSPAGMAQVAQQATESQRIQQENELRQQRNARRGEVASEIAAQEASLASLEKRAAGLGKVITGNQDSVSRMMANRNPANQTGLSASLNQIQAQAESLALIANNSAIASTAYNRFTVAAEMASIKLARAQQNTFTALAAGFSGGGGSSIPEGLRRASDVAGARSMVGQVLTEMPTIATGASEAALGSYINMLQNLKTLVPALSIEYRALEEGIARANEEMRSAQLGIVDAPSSRLGSLQAVTQRQRFEDREQKVQEKRQKDINDVFEKQNDLIDKINSSRLSGDQKVDLRERAERAVNALIENRLEDSREMTRLIERQLKAAVDLAKPKPPQFFGVPGKDFLPITGKLTGGDLVPGSPAAKNRIAEEERKAADREFAKNASAFKDLTKYTQEAERNAQKLQAGYDRLDLTQALDEYLADLSNVERAADQLLKKLSTVPGTGQSSIKDFDSRLKAAVEGNGASKQLSSQTLQLEKLQKRLVEVEIDGVDVSQNKARVEKLIADIKSGQIPTSKQSVDLVAKELKDARARLGISQSQAKIDGKIADVLRGAVGDPSKKINDLAAQQKYAIEINDTYQKTEEILTSIGKASIPEAQKLALSFGIDQARNELYENRLESAQMITKEINKQLGLETAMQAGATKKKLTESSWGLAFEKAKDIRQDMGTEGLQERNEAQRIMMNQLSALQDIQTRYAIEEKKGVQLVGEKITLSNLINRIKNDELGLTIANTEAIGESIRLLNAAGRYRKNEAILNDSYGGSSSGNKATETTAQQLEARRERLLNLARGGLGQLITLESKGVTVSSQKLEIEQAISDIQSLRNKASQQELATLASKVVAARNFASAMAIDLKAGALPGVGLQAALQKLQEARGARQDFFGGASPAEAIDKIVREFNTEKSGGAIGGAASAGENAVNSYVNGIKGGIPAAADAMADLGKAGITAIKKALGIASPSRVMLEIAKNQIDTYVNFLRSALPQVEAAAKAIGEVGIPPGGGVPEEAIIKPISERRKTEFLDAEEIQRNRVIAGFAASNLTGPISSKDEVARFNQITDKITEFINQTRTSIDREKFFGSHLMESAEVAMGARLPSPELKAMLATMADFYGVPAELTPNLERVAASGDQAKQEAIQLNAVIDKFVKGLNDIANLINTGAALASPSKIQDPFAEARRIADETDASNAAAAREKAKVQEVFKDSIAKAAEMDAKNVKKATADSFAAARAQADADAKSAADILSRQILDPVETAAPEGGRRIGSAIEELFDRVAEALGFGGNGIGRGGPGNPRPPAGGGAGGNFSRDPGDLARQAAAAAQQGPEALLGLAELTKPAKASTAELEALSAVLKELRSVLDPTIQGFDRLDNQLRETAANIDRQIERRAPDADFLTRRFGPRSGAAISEGLIGGAFPLLFGQDLGASLGGLAGGAAGGFLGGGLGFGLSLAGTALGNAVDEADKLDKELIKVNASAKGVGNTSADVDRLASSLGVAKDEAVKVLEQFRQFSSAEIRRDLALVFGAGRDAILEKFESIVKEEDVLQAIVASRKEIGNEEAISLVHALQAQGSVRTQLMLREALLRVAEKETIEQLKKVRIQDRLLALLSGFGAGPLDPAGSSGPRIDSKIFGEERAKEQQKLFDKERQQRTRNIDEAVKESQKLFKEVDKLSESYSEKERKRKEKGKDNSSQIAAEAARQAEQLARNQIELDNAVFRNRMQLADQEYEIRKRIVGLLENLLETQAPSAERGAVSFVNEISGIQRGYNAEVRQLQQEIARAGQELKSASAMISAQRAGVVSVTAGSGKVSGASGVTATSVAGYPITSRQGMRKHPVTGAMKMHQGTDIGTPSGTALSYSVGGSVTQATSLGGYGKVLEVQLENGVTAFAAHLNEVMVKVGQKFAANQLLARTGATGIGTRPHLHMEGRKGSDSTAPLPFLRLGGKPSGVLARGQSQVIGADGDTAVAKANLNSQVAASQRLIPLLKQERDLKIELAVANKVQSIMGEEDGLTEIEKEIEKRKIRNRLALKGVAPEIIEGEIRLYDAMLESSKILGGYKNQVASLKLVRDKATVSTIEAALADYSKVSAARALTDAETAIVLQLETKLGLLKTIEAVQNRSNRDAEKTRSAAKESVMTPREKVDEKIGKLREELAALTNTGNIAISVADGIGNAFDQAFQGLISGSMSAQEALSSFFKGVASTFLSMAAEIIAKQMAMITLQTILRALGAFVGGGGGGGGVSTPWPSGLDFNPSAFAMPALAANGAYFSNGTATFANGGAFSNSIVSSPTLFRFADGGVTKTGEMGEAGPEAIMPLRRGPGGRLGVDASGLRAAMGPAPGSSSASQVLSMSFETTNFGGTEYVSREQLELAMAETRKAATKDGANRGMTMTLDRIKNSGSTRRRIGV
ncbi:Peptidase M23 [uncultured Caudovirales phage]|uniref:Peptidase M23 n=1 Tax=uncultured Caudovirales phage TaxID=2100421 RepID=A0A6J5MSG1_9CAUD|nr:Peptidase M23 [uncultured Caudovirales phage]